MYTPHHCHLRRRHHHCHHHRRRRCRRCRRRVAIFFLLGFRANASNDRYYEGRKQWGMVRVVLSNLCEVDYRRTVSNSMALIRVPNPR